MSGQAFWTCCTHVSATDSAVTAAALLLYKQAGISFNHEDCNNNGTSKNCSQDLTQKNEQKHIAWNKQFKSVKNNFRYKWGIKQKLFRIKKTLVSNKISYQNIFQMWVGYTFFDPKYFFDQATGGSKCSSSPLEGIKKKIFQTEIDFDVGSRLPPGAAIQNMNPFWVGLRFIDGCFRVYFGVGLRFFWGIGIRSV